MKVKRPKIIGRQAGVYKLEFNGGWFYIGGSNNLCRRFSQWKRKLLGREYLSSNNINFLMRELNEAELSVVEFCSPDELVEMEKSYIRASIGNELCLNCCIEHNIKEKWAFGTTSKLRYKQDAPVAKRVAQFSLSNELIRIFPSVTQAAKELGVKHTKINDVVMGRKKARFVRRTVLKLIDENGCFIEPPNHKKILKIDKDGCVVGEYYLLTEAAKSVGADKRHVEKVVNKVHKYKTAKGYSFRYADK